MIKLSLDQPQPTQPRPAETTPINLERTGKFDYFWYVAFSLAIGLLIGFVAGSRFDSFENQKQDDQIIEPDDSEKKSDAKKVEAAGSVFVFIYEFQTKTADQELLVRDLRAWSQLNKCEFRQFDQDSKDSEPYKIAAEKAGLKSPFMAVVRDRKIVRVFDWPRDRIALEGLVK